MSGYGLTRRRDFFCWSKARPILSATGQGVWAALYVYIYICVDIFMCF